MSLKPGAGRSVVRLLRRDRYTGKHSALPADVVKIDRSFVHGLGRDPVKETLVWAISSLAHALDKRVIAEGVETETEWELLRSQRCDEAQGYLFSRPLPATAALENLLRTKLGPAPAANSAA